MALVLVSLANIYTFDATVSGRSLIYNKKIVINNSHLNNTTMSHYILL